MDLQQANSLSSEPNCARISIRLLSGFEVESDEGRIQFPTAASRLIAYLALQDQPVTRAAVAGVLWPETCQEKAQGSLRSTLWRVRRVDETVVVSSHDCLMLAEKVNVDTTNLVEAVRVMENGGPPPDPDSVPVGRFSAELLPDWYEDWVMFERERFRLMALHALEQMAAWHTEHRNLGLAFECALAAVKLEPLRESAYRALIIAHIAEGNAYEAVGCYRHYQQLLNHELGIGPSEQMLELVRNLGCSEKALSVSRRREALA